MFPDSDSVSAHLYDRATEVLVGGNSRFSVFTPPYQLYAARGVGSRVFDVDGNELLDFQNNMTVLIHGHAHPLVVERVVDQVRHGSCFGLATESEIQLAELLCDRVPGFERVRFVNSGTEAVMTAIKVARAKTGRPKIAKVEGAYHGSYDYAEVSLTSSPDNWGDINAPHSVAYAYGTPQGVLDDVVVIPFNQPDKALSILHKVKHDLAGVIIDPLPGRVGLIPATSEFLAALRDFTSENGSLLIFDEVICFRLGYRGAQNVVGCEPDLTALGKVVGGGFPIGVVAGREQVMSVFDLRKNPPPLLQGGTFNANPVSMAAGVATLELLTEAAVSALNALGETTRRKLSEAFKLAGVAGQVTGAGSLFRIHPHDRAIHDYRSSLATAEETRSAEGLWRHLINNGVLLNKMGMGCVSTATSAAEVDIFAQAMFAGLGRVAAA